MILKMTKHLLFFGLINTNIFVNSGILLRERERERERERRRRISLSCYAHYIKNIIIYSLFFIIFSEIAKSQYRRGFLRLYHP